MLVDADLSGLLVGMTLATTAPEIYRALLEATAFGTRVIIEAFESAGVPVAGSSRAADCPKGPRPRRRSAPATPPAGTPPARRRGRRRAPGRWGAAPPPPRRGRLRLGRDAPRPAAHPATRPTGRLGAPRRVRGGRRGAARRPAGRGGGDGGISRASSCGCRLRRPAHVVRATRRGGTKATAPRGTTRGGGEGAGAAAGGGAEFLDEWLHRYAPPARAVRRRRHRVLAVRLVDEELSVGRSQDVAAHRLHVPVGVFNHDVLSEAGEKGLEIALVPPAHLPRHGIVRVFGHGHTILPRHRRASRTQ